MSTIRLCDAASVLACFVAHQLQERGGTIEIPEHVLGKIQHRYVMRERLGEYDHYWLAGVDGTVQEWTRDRGLYRLELAAKYILHTSRHEHALIPPLELLRMADIPIAFSKRGRSVVAYFQSTRKAAKGDTFTMISEGKIDVFDMSDTMSPRSRRN